MDKQVFREKSLKKASNPDHLTDYIRVLKPGLVLVVICAALMICGFVVWEAFGYKIDHRQRPIMVSYKNGYVLLYDDEEDIITDSTEVVYNGISSTMIDEGGVPMPVSLVFKPFSQNLEELGLSMDQEVYIRKLTGDYTDIPDGAYMADVRVLVTE